MVCLLLGCVCSLPRTVSLKRSRNAGSAPFERTRLHSDGGACHSGGGASVGRADDRAGGDELRLQPPAVLHLGCKVLRWPGEQASSWSVSALKPPFLSLFTQLKASVTILFPPQASLSTA